jgi:hypothetical protein
MPYATAAAFGSLFCTRVWSHTAYFAVLESDSALGPQQQYKTELLTRFHVMEGAYPIFVNVLASAWFLLCGLAGGVCFLIFALRFTQNKLVLVSFRHMTNEQTAREWELPFLNLKTLRGIRTFVALRQFYLQVRG